MANSKRKTCLISFLGIITSLCIFALSGSSETEKLSPVTSRYSAFLESKDLLQKSKAAAIIVEDTDHLGLVCFKDPDDDLYIGAGQLMDIDTPMEDVTKILDRFEDYPKWFDGLVSIDVPKNRGAIFPVQSEQEVPIISNVITKMIYHVDKAPTSASYRYQLAQKGSMLAYDGWILLEKIDAKKTRYIEYDFMSADWGIAKILGKGKIWRDTLRGIYQQDIAIKMRAENSKLSDAEVKAQSIKKADSKDYDPCIDHKTIFRL